MEANVLFKEEQKFKQWWLWLLIIGLNAFAIYNLVSNSINKNSIETATIVSAIVMVLVAIFFYIMNLKTKIYNDRIEIKFLPFGIHKVYNLKDVEQLEIIKYNPILEYGGWGIRFGAYNISGNMGLKIHYKKTNFIDSILIGTQKEEELSKIIKSIQHA